VRLAPDSQYLLVLARRSRGGIVARGVRLGKQIRTPSQYEVHAGDFLVSRRQIVHGACGLIPDQLHGAIVSNEYTVLQTSGRLLPEFLELLCETPYLQRTFYHSSVGVHVEKMVFREREWFQYQVHYPSVSEQRAIVRCLALWPKAMEMIRRLLTLAERRKRGLMLDLLQGSRRSVGVDAQRWPATRLAAVAAINPEDLPADTPRGREFAYIDLSAVDHGRLVGGPRRVTFGEAPSRARRIVRQGDILLSTVRPGLLGHLLVRDPGPDRVCSTGFAVIRPKAPADAPILYHQLLGDAVQQQLNVRVAGSGFPAVSANDVKALRVAYPPTADERRRLGALLEDMEKEIDRLIRFNEALARQRGCLAEMLLTGKLRVPESSW